MTAAVLDESQGSSEALLLRLLCPLEDSLGSTRDCLLEFALELGTVRTRPRRDLQTIITISTLSPIVVKSSNVDFVF